MGFLIYPATMGFRVLAFVGVILSCASASADLGDIAIGGQMSVGAIEMQTGYDDGPSMVQQLTLQPEFNLRVGLLDWLHFDGGVGLVFFDGSTGGTIDIGLTGTFDVFALVPELKLGLFTIMFQDGDLLRFMPGVDASLALRYHLDFNWSVAVGAELNAAIVPRYQGTLSFLYVID